jgi:hypothetical protein
MFSDGAWGAGGGSIVANGGFTGSTYTVIFQPVTDILPVDWSVLAPTPSSASDINVVSASSFPGFTAPNSSGFYVAFMSKAQNNTQDCFYQDLATVAGQKYTLTFSAAITSASPYLMLLPDWDALGTDRVEIPLTGFNANNAAVSSTGPIAFQTFTISNLTASSNSTRLYFHGVDSQGAVLLDNVSVTPQSSAPASSSDTDVPLPLWSLGMLGAVLFGVGARPMGAGK